MNVSNNATIQIPNGSTNKISRYMVLQIRRSFSGSRFGRLRQWVFMFVGVVWRVV